MCAGLQLVGLGNGVLLISVNSGVIVGARSNTDLGMAQRAAATPGFT